MPTAYGIVNEDNGFIEMDSIKGSGTTFRIYLPAAEGAKEAPCHAPKRHLQKGTQTILFAEDGDDVRETTRLILENLGDKETRTAEPWRHPQRRCEKK